MRFHQNLSIRRINVHDNDRVTVNKKERVIENKARKIDKKKKKKKKLSLIEKQISKHLIVLNRIL